MPLNPEDVLREGDEYAETLKNGYTPRGGGSGPSDAEYTSFFERVPDGKRNDTLTRYVGMLRRRLPISYEAALSMALDWNGRYCDPPLDTSEVDGVVGRAWHEWTAGNDPDFKPEDVTKPIQTERTLLNVNDLLDLEESGHGLEWLVPNVFVKGGIHFVSAPAAGAKSWLMLDLCRCVVSGTPWLGQYDIPQGAVLYIDEEMGENNTSTRVKKLDFQRDVPFYYIGKQGLKLSSAEDRRFILDTLKRLDIKLLCLDTLTGLIPGLKENENEHVSILRSYFNEFTMTGATLLVAHHDRKGGQGDSNTPHERMAGGRDFGAMTDMAYGIDKRGSVFHLSVTKNRFVAEDDLLSIDFTLDDNEDKTKVNLRVLSSDERVTLNQRKTESTIEERILDALSLNGAQNTRGLLAIVEGSPNLVTQVAKRMAADGAIKAVKEGQQVIYSLDTDTL